MAETAKDIGQQWHAQRRQAAREPVDLPSRASRPGREPLLVRLVDISPFGLHARFQGTPFQRGEHILIELPLLGEVRAQVMWGLKGCFGCKFALPVDARTFLRMLAAIRECGEDWLD